MWRQLRQEGDAKAPPGCGYSKALAAKIQSEAEAEIGLGVAAVPQR